MLRTFGVWFAHTREVQGLNSLTAAFEDEAGRWTLFSMLG